MSDDPSVQSRMGSVGRVVPGVEVEIRLSNGTIAGPGEHGEVYLRGAQVSGEYLNGGGAEKSWFDTRDLGYFDDEQYLFIIGRVDDTIIRGGENIAPAMIEDVLLEYPGVGQAVVVGMPDEEWGQRIVAVVVSDGRTVDRDDLLSWSAGRLRSSLAPRELHVWDELPTNDAGKVVRRDVIRQLSSLERQHGDR